jgi:16S rRNA G966 N2-methylase RsmD|uniref:Methyltransferase n=1 Tax=viral metagenome TaxID=1070528 RepID=A0A6C0IWS2_9ZZZZ
MDRKKKTHKFVWLLNDYFPIDVIKKLRYDTEASYSVTDPTISEHICSVLLKQPNISTKSVITDGFASVGGNTWFFAKYFSTVKANELDKTRFHMLSHNLKVLGQRKKVKVYNRNYLDLYDKLSQDIIWLDPPWLIDEKTAKKFKLMYSAHDIPTYKSLKQMRIYLRQTDALLPPIEISELIGKRIKKTKYIGLKIPKNYDLKYLRKMITGSFSIFTIEEYPRPNSMKIIYLKKI